ncbi:SDR family NAD(P)-dependent oxidoreductase [Streptomyces sp. NPDC005202]|uniref:SDR family NAD(P)-dependent oxidoreductase n=1 Tax=Streptomyces sp. NPDC005202 TaxID=3157021 RepID=UPI00339E4519
MDNSHSPPLSGRTVVVTGGTRGVGAGIARAFVEAGADVVTCARRPPEVPVAGAEFEPLDLRDPAAVRDFFHALPRLDVLVNNAGGTPYRLLTDAEPERHARVVELNLLTPLTASLAAYEHLKRARGAVVMIGSVTRTRMTERAFAETMAAPASGFDAMAPENVSPLVVWLGSPASAGVSGRVFEAEAGRITVMEGWRPGPTADKGARWTPAEAGEAALKLLAEAEVPGAVYGA